MRSFGSEEGPKNASPAALDKLRADQRANAFSPPPELRVATEIQFDAWALTSIREPLAAHPPVAPYLHGKTEWEPFETHLAWREEPDIIRGELLSVYPQEDLLDDFPLKPHELLCDSTKRISESLSALIEKHVQEKVKDIESIPEAWLVDALGNVGSFSLIPSVSVALPE